jgi:hypothetical protein
VLSPCHVHCLADGSNDYLTRVTVFAAAAAPVFRAHALFFPDAFVGLSLMGAALSGPALVAALLAARQAGCRTCEVMVHPGDDHSAADPCCRFGQHMSSLFLN